MAEAVQVKVLGAPRPVKVDWRAEARIRHRNAIEALERFAEAVARLRDDPELGNMAFWYADLIRKLRDVLEDTYFVADHPWASWRRSR